MFFFSGGGGEREVVQKPINTNPELTAYKNYIFPWQLNLD